MKQPHHPSSKCGLVSRADLLHTQAQAQLESVLFIAAQLGLDSDFSQLQPLVQREVQIDQRSESFDLLDPDLPHIDPSARLDPHFWLLAGREPRVLTHEAQESASENASNSVQSIASPPLAWSNQPKNPPKYQTLLSASVLLKRLLPRLQQLETGRKVDLNKVMNTLSRAEPLSRLPRQARLSAQLTLQIIDDRSRHLTCYWQDHFFVSKTLLARRDMAVSLAVWVDGDAMPNTISVEGLQDWQLKPHSSVLLLSDLGALNQAGGRGFLYYQRLGLYLQRQACQALVLLPCAIQAVHPELRRLFHCLSWEQPSSDTAFNAQSRNMAADKLLTALAPSIRIEPGLLRTMRLRMAQQHGADWTMPAAIEAHCWQHKALQERHSVAASWHAEQRQGYLKHFAALSAAEKSTALAVIRSWRPNSVSENIGYEELLSLDEASLALAEIEADIQQAREKVRYMQRYLPDAQQGEQGNEEQAALSAYYRRMGERLPTDCIAAEPEVQRLLQRVGVTDLRGIDPANLSKQNQVNQQLALYQQGNTLHLRIQPPSMNPPESGYSPLAVLQARQDFVRICDRDGRELGHLSLDDEQGFVLDSHQQLVVYSDKETFELSTMLTPAGVDMGRDRFGLFVDVPLYEHHLRLRYMEPTRRGNLANWLSDTRIPRALLSAITGFSEQQLEDERYKAEVNRLLGQRVGNILSGWVTQLAPGGLGDSNSSTMGTVEHYQKDSASWIAVQMGMLESCAFFGLSSPNERYDTGYYSDARLYLESQAFYTRYHAFDTDVPVQNWSWQDYFTEMDEPAVYQYQARLNLLDQCQQAFQQYPHFKDMPLAERKMIAGLHNPEGNLHPVPGLFGNMQSAGRFHKLINENNEIFSLALDEIPLTGRVGYDHLQAYQHQIQTGLREQEQIGLGIGSLTRLLAMKRPDVFIGITTANRYQLAEWLGISVKLLQTLRLEGHAYWDKVIAPIQASRWWNQPPSKLEGASPRLWRYRAAMLDALCYELKHSSEPEPEQITPHQRQQMVQVIAALLQDKQDLTQEQRIAVTQLQDLLNTPPYNQKTNKALARIWSNVSQLAESSELVQFALKNKANIATTLVTLAARWL